MERYETHKKSNIRKIPSLQELFGKLWGDKSDLGGGQRGRAKSQRETKVAKKKRDKRFGRGSKRSRKVTYRGAKIGKKKRGW